MTENFLTPETRRFLRRLQFFLGIIGFVMLMSGLLRTGLELLGTAGDIAESFDPALFSTETLIIGGIYLAVGYLALYAMAAVGAKEPPALPALRYSLMGIGVALWITVIWALFAGTKYFITLLIVTILLSLLVLRFWQQTEARNLWQIFGERITRSMSDRQRMLLIAVIGGVLIILAALGIIYAILSNRIELPAGSPNAGELLYTTSFDEFNDEWDLPRGRQSAEIVDGELVLTENSRILDSAFYARLDSRRFSDFDLRVRTRQLEGDIDNAYGVIFRWRDFDNYYRFEISGDGYYRLSKTEDGTTETISLWVPTEIVHQGSTNELRVVAKEDTFTFYINGQLAKLCTRGENNFSTMNSLTGEWQDSYQDDSFRQGKIALLAGTTQTTDMSEPVVIAFDNLLLTGPQ